MGELTLQGAPDHLPVPLRFKLNRRARRYILRIAPDGAVTVTVPCFGSRREALAFAGRNMEWIQRHLRKLASRMAMDQSWKPGTEVLLDGQPAQIRVDHSIDPARVCLGEHVVGAYPAEGSDLRRTVEIHLWRMAWALLPARVEELNAGHEFPVQRVTVRNQRSRWGSCSRRGTISLNWRLIQAPPLVRDYIIIHELAHLRHMNHSSRFWAEVERLCPEYRTAEAWLKKNSGLLR